MQDTLDPTPAPPRPRRRWLRRLVKLFVVLGALVVVAPLALGLAPVRRFVAGKVSDALGRQVTIGGISAAWWSGIELRNVEIHNPEGYTGDPLLAVDRVKVDASVWKALTGAPEATVTVDHPVVTLIQGKDGHSNLDGLGGEKKDEKKATSGGALPHLVLTVRDGRLAAYGAPGADAGKPDVIDALTIDAELKPTGEKILKLSAVARGARAGGGDVDLRMDAHLDAKGAGPVTMSVPALDLARLAKTAGTALGVDGLAGALQVDANLVLDPATGGSGKAAVSVSNVIWRKGGGAVSMKALAFEASPSRAGDATRFDVALAVQGLKATGFSNRDTGLDEPLIKVVGVVTRQKNGDLSFGDATAPVRIEGRTLSGTLSGSLRDLDGDAASADVVAKLSVALSPTLGRLSGALSSPDDDLRGTVSLDASVKGQGGKLVLHADGRILGLTVGGAPGATSYTEPTVTMGMDGTWDGAAHTLTLSKAQLGAGAIRAAAKGPVTFTSAPKTTLTGTFEVDADLARLSGLAALMPSVSSVSGGTLHGEIVATQAGDLTIDALVTGKDLAFTPGTLSSRGYLERNVALTARVAIPASGPMTVEVSKLPVGPGDARERQRTPPAAARRRRPGPRRDRDADRQPPSRRHRLRQGDRAGARADDLRLPRPRGGTWLHRGRRRLRREARGPRPDVPRRAGAGPARRRREDPDRREGGYDLPGGALACEATGSTSRGASAGSLGVTGSVETIGGSEGHGRHGARVGDLRREGRPRGGPAAPRRRRLEPRRRDPLGTLTSHVEVKTAKPGLRLDGKTTITRLQYAGAPDPKTGKSTTLTEPSVQLEHRIWLDAEPDLMRLEKVTLVAESLTASVAGTSRTRGEDHDLSLDVSVDGDATRLADDLRALLGEGYEDMAGEGRVTGKFAIVGPTAHDGRDLKVDGNLAFQRFSSAGLTVEDGKVVVARPAPGTPLTVAVTAKVNRGTLKVESSCDLGKGESPWSARLTVRGLDTSPLVTGKGSSRYLSLVLPAIVPADATSSVLSGLLDANLDVKSDALRQPHLADTLSGPGDVHMTQGSVKNSTLFQGMTGGGGGGMSQLLKFVPGVGKEFESLSRALMFQDLSSKFTIGGRRIQLNPVTLVSPSINLTFTGVVGFDGATELRIPLKLSGDVGHAISPYVKDQTIPLKASQKAGGTMKVTPDLKLENVGAGLIDDLFGKKKPK